MKGNQAPKDNNKEVQVEEIYSKRKSTYLKIAGTKVKFPAEQLHFGEVDLGDNKKIIVYYDARIKKLNFNQSHMLDLKTKGLCPILLMKPKNKGVFAFSVPYEDMFRQHRPVLLSKLILETDGTDQQIIEAIDEWINVKDDCTKDEAMQLFGQSKAPNLVLQDIRRILTLYHEERFIKNGN